MNEYLLASPADHDLAAGPHASNGSADETSESHSGATDLARSTNGSVAVVAHRSADAAAAQSWDVGGVVASKRRWYDRFEPPARRILDAPSDGSSEIEDWRGKGPRPPAEPSVNGATAGRDRSVPAAIPGIAAVGGASAVAAIAAVAPRPPDTDIPESTPQPVAEVVAPQEPVAPNGVAPATVDYIAPRPTSNGASAASNGSTTVTAQEVAADAGSSTLRRLDGSVPEAAPASTAVIVDDVDLDEFHRADMGLSEAARYHNAEFEISEVESHDPVLSRTVIEWIAVVAGALIVALVIKAALFQAFYIPSPSMVPTLLEDDRVLVNKLSYKLHDIRAGDVLVFERPSSELGADDSDLIKRVIGLPGDRIKAEGGKLFVDGAELDEYYLTDVQTSDFDEIVVPPGEMWVMGDNRGNSKDSRVYGTVDQDLVVGRAFVRVWPLSRIGLL